MGSIKGQKHNPYIEGKYGHLNPNDVVFTPDWLAKQIVDMFPIEGKVLEPCKGEGAFLQYLPDDADWCEIAEGKNYYDYEKKVDWIVTNPPYSDFNRFLDHSFDLADNIVLLVPVAKMFKSMGTLQKIYKYGGFVEIYGFIELPITDGYLRRRLADTFNLAQMFIAAFANTVLGTSITIPHAVDTCQLRRVIRTLDIRMFDALH